MALVVAHILVASVVTFDIRLNQARKFEGIDYGALPGWVTIFFCLQWFLWLAMAVLKPKWALLVFVVKLTQKVLPVLVAPAIAGEFDRPRRRASRVGRPDPQLVLALEMVVDSGEAEAIIVASKNKCLLLTDDKQARKVAKTLGVNVIGTVGMLIRVKQQGLIDVIKPVISSLESTGFYISSPLIPEALDIVGE